MTVLIKILGALMLIGGAAVIGLRAVENLDNRVRLYSALIHALDLMQAEIFFRLTPLPELMEQLSRQIEPPVSLLFQDCFEHMRKKGSGSFSLIWEGTLRRSIGRELSSSALTSLCELGGILGRYDAQTQSNAILHAAKRMESCYESAQREKDRQSRVYGILGVISGLAAVIILL